MKIKEYIRADKGEAIEGFIIVLCSIVLAIATFAYLTHLANKNSDPDPEITVIEKAEPESPEKEPILIENSTINIDQVDVYAK